MATAISASPLSTARRAGSRCASPSSSTAPPRSRVFGSTAPNKADGASPTRPAPMRPTGPKAQDMADPAAEGHAPDRLDLAALYAESEIGQMLAALDDDLVGLLPVKRRIREITAHLFVTRARQMMGLATGTP